MQGFQASCPPPIALATMKRGTPGKKLAPSCAHAQAMRGYTPSGTASAAWRLTSFLGGTHQLAASPLRSPCAR